MGGVRETAKFVVEKSYDNKALWEGTEMHLICQCFDNI